VCIGVEVANWSGGNAGDGGGRVHVSHLVHAHCACTRVHVLKCDTCNQMRHVLKCDMTQV